MSNQYRFTSLKGQISSDMGTNVNELNTGHMCRDVLVGKITPHKTTKLIQLIFAVELEDNLNKWGIGYTSIHEYCYTVAQAVAKWQIIPWWLLKTPICHLPVFLGIP